MKRRTSEPTWARLGCGASAMSSSSRRSTPSRRRSSVSASRPVSSTVANAAWAWSGLRSASRRAAAACTVIALSAWATTSCSSPAIRVRSSSAALSAAPWRLSASCCAFSRSAALSRDAVAHDLGEQHRRRDAERDRVHERGDVVRVGVGGRRERVERDADERAEGQVAALGVGADGVGREQHPEERQRDVLVPLPAADLEDDHEAAEHEGERGHRDAPPHGQPGGHDGQRSAR